jgi:HTTM domain
MTQSGTRRPGRGLIAGIREFFYAEEVPYGLALMRIVLPVVLMIAAVPRWPHVREIFSSAGTPTPLWESYGVYGLLPIPGAELAVALYTALLFFLVAGSLGWMTRLSLIAATLLYAWFSTLDMLGTMTKYNVIATHALFLLSLSHCGSVWSVDAILARRRHAAPAVPARYPAWPRRLLQLLVGVIYLAGAVTKMHTPLFFSGDQMVFWMLTDINFNNPIGDYLALYPAVVPVLAYITIVWEVLFLFLAWRGRGRTCMLSLGVLFHVLTWGVLGLIIFPLVYLCLYLAFINERDVDRLTVLLSRWGRRWTPALQTGFTPGRLFRMPSGVGPGQSAAMFGLLLAVSTVLGVEVEHRSDPFGLHRPEGPYALKPIPADRVAELLTEPDALLARDKLFAFELGSRMVGGILANRRTSFSYGEDAIVQCCLLPPHEDLWVEFNLHDASDRVVKRNGRIVPRENLRSNIVFHFDESIPAGEYAWVLNLDGREVGRKPFTLGNVQQASAMSH